MHSRGLKDGFPDAVASRRDRDTVNRENLERMLYGGVVLGVLALFGLSLTLDGGGREALVREDGVVEMLTVVLYFLCLGVMLAKGDVRFFGTFWYLALVPLLFALRELDLHKEFTTMGIFKSEFYFSSAVPFLEKVVGAGVIVLAVSVVVLIVKNYGKVFCRELKQLSPRSTGVVLTGGFLVSAKAIDGLGRKLDVFGIRASEALKTHSGAFEEIMELGIPGLMIILVCFHCHRGVGANPGEGRCSQG